MKRMLCILMTLFLLCGCAPAGETQPTTMPTETTLPVETTVPDLLMNARCWEGNPELMELELPFQPDSGSLTLGMLGDNLLFWQLLYHDDGYAKATQFWLIDSQSGKLLNQYTHNVGEYVYGIQVQPHRVCICDSVAGTVTILGTELEVQSRWEADLGWNQCFMGYGDTLYVLTDEYLLKRDLSTGEACTLLDGVTGLYCQSFEPTGVNLGHYDPETGKWLYLWLEFATDRLD